MKIMDDSKELYSTIRRENGLIEAVCKHGVGHPVYGSVDWMVKYNGHDADTLFTHGCDGCCADERWQIETLRDAVEKGNDLIIQHKEFIKSQNRRFVEMRDEIEELRADR